MLYKTYWIAMLGAALVTAGCSSDKQVPPVTTAPAESASAVIAAQGEDVSESVKAAVEGFIGAPAVTSVALTPYGALYEVVLKSGQVVYTDAEVSFVLDGRVIDTATRRDVTAARLEALSAIDFASLPLDQAIKQVKGDGSRVIATFEDPNCGYCKRLGKDLDAMDNVTIYTFLYPILSEDSTRKSRDIWCAQDQSSVWNDWIVRAVVPPTAECDSSVVDKNVAFGQSLGINGTPTIFLADGRRLGGYLPPDKLEEALAGVAP